jgi:CheY-like chemotaxis protein
MKTMPRVLLVQRDSDERRTLAGWAEEAGYEVVTCSGPSAPSYVCVGDGSGGCPLVDEADVVVLDCRLECEEMGEGTAAVDLLSFYLCSGRPVVALGSTGLAPLFEGEDVVFLDERGPGGGLVETIDRLANRRILAPADGPFVAAGTSRAI